MSGISPVELLSSAVPEGEEAPPDTNLLASAGLPDWLRRHRVSLAFSCYQSSQLFLAGVTPAGQVSFSYQAFGQAMGLARKGGSLYLGALFQVWRIENMLPPGQVVNGVHDAVFVPRLAWTTGHIDVHEVGVLPDGKPLFAATKYNCLATIDPVHSFKVAWKPQFISEIVGEDRCHLNGIAMDRGKARYVTALRRADVKEGWRDGPDRGVLIDVERNRILRDDLFIPHSPRLHEGALYLLESARGYLVRIDLKSGEKTDVCFLPGFIRGLSFHAGHALVTLSRPRKSSFDGVPLDDEIAARGIETWCGVAIVDLAKGEIVEWIKLEGKIIQLFDVLALPDIQCPMLIGPRSDEIANIVSIDPASLPKAQRQKQL
jgi:uncharacterized protein (TIGR03032 family)